MTELSPEVKKLFSVARGSMSPTDDRVAAVRDALHARIASGGSGSGGANDGAGGGATDVVSGMPSWLGVSLFVTLLLTTFAGIYQTDFMRSSAEGTSILAPAPIASAPPEQEVVPSPLEGETQLAAASANEQPPKQEVRTRRPDGKRPPKTRKRPSPESAREDRTTRLAANDGSGEEFADGAAPVNTSFDDMVAELASKPAPTSAAKPTPPADDSLALEIALVRSARRALARGDAHEALTYTQQYAARFPNGRLRQERLATRVLALCALHRNGEARAATQSLEEMAPRSPHLMRIRASCPAQTMQ
jgi:hypothetical protein